MSPRQFGFRNARPLVLGLGAFLLLVSIPSTAFGLGQRGTQDTTTRRDSTITREAVSLEAIVVTATLSPTEVFNAAQPASVLSETMLRRTAPNTISDMFRTMPGLTVTGVGASQVRPNIRGQQGQRVLLLDDGIRLNNSRRQQDFGEVPSLVDVGTLERAEVVRGPASVLYGTDAIGGVVNLIPRTPADAPLAGALGYRHSSADGQNKFVGNVSGRSGRFGFLVGGTYRNVDQYDAPSGSFGEITLGDRTTVFDTGVRDGSLDAFLSYDLGSNHSISARYRLYRADSAGFGFVDPEAYAPGSADIRITYPDQKFDKLTLRYVGSNLRTPIVDQLSVQGYGQRNERRLDLSLFAPFDPVNLPGAGIDSRNKNFTDMRTFGGRLEAKKFLAGRHTLTYGADFFNDDSEGWDTTVTAVVGFGPPTPDVSTTPNVPNGSFRSFGFFAQGEVALTDRATVILGARYQNVRAKTDDAPDLLAPVDQTDQTVVGAFNAIYRITDGLNVVGALGRAFRSPDLVERFFNGVTPEGAAVQIPNPDLKAETSLNVDLGLRFRNRFLSAEGFVFRNEISDGIRIQSTGDTINMLPVFTNVNVDKLRFKGVELAADAFLPYGFAVGGTYTYLSTTDVLDPNNPVGDTFSNNVAGTLRYTHPSDRLWISYELRHNGDRKDVLLGNNPVGSILPSFTVQSVRASGLLFRTGRYTQRVGVSLVNLANELYAEFPNASFFRPEPRRNLILSFDATF